MSDSAAPGRIDAVDLARGLALVGMAVYHFTWDLAYFGLIPEATPFSWAMRTFSHGIASAFLALVGVSLAIAHRGGWNGRAFVGRLAKVAAAAATVSVATSFVAPEAPILFGILHCIVVASLIAAAFLPAPGWIALAAGAAAVASPWVFANSAFDAGWLLWLGLGTREPSTLDWRPLLPWAGVTLIGLGAAKLAAPRLLASPLARWRPKWAPGRALAFGGRHSLAVYLIHQPALLALLFVGTQVTGFTERREAERYLAACRPACVEAGGEIDSCDKACACVVKRALGEGLAASLSSRAAADADRAKVGAIVAACGDAAR